MPVSQNTRRGRIERWLNGVWYGNASGGLLLVPLALLYRIVTGLRRFLYAIRLLPSHDAGAPVVVVGNITAGGTGKTPFVIWLATRLRADGWQVAVVSRGYGARVGSEPLRVDPDAQVGRAGDEALLIANRADVPVFCHPNRVAAARRAVEEGAEVVIADDGLQHLALKRDVEIAMVDGVRRVGNGRLMPAGPLREPVGRLRTVDIVVCTGGRPENGEISMRLELGAAYRVADGERRPLSEFADHPCHAIAGIANPQRFFDALSAEGIEVIGLAPGDHARLEPADVEFSDSAPVLMTEKDAMRVRDFAVAVHWAVPATAVIETTDAARITGLIERALAREAM